MSTYNTFYDDRTRTTIAQAIDSEGQFCVVFTRGIQQQVRICADSDEQYEVFQRNVKWYRGY